MFYNKSDKYDVIKDIEKRNPIRENKKNYQNGNVNVTIF